MGYYPDEQIPFWRRPLLLGGVAVVLVIALLGYLWSSSGDDAKPAGLASPEPTSTLPQVPGGKYGFAAERATDSKPLTTGELFGSKKFKSHGRSYVMTVRRYDKSCKDAVTGTTLAKSLKAGSCNQLVRASFRDAKGTIIGTVGVANLKTSKAAKKVADAGAAKERKDYLKPLAGKDEHTKSLGTGEAYAGGWVHGHYAVLLWFQFKDGHEPKKSELKKLYQAAVDITDATVFEALTTRSLTGAAG